MPTERERFVLPGCTTRGTDAGWATMSDCGRYRYALGRRWSETNLFALAVIMLNPSTANHDANDPTIRKCIHFAKQEGCGALLVRNLFAARRDAIAWPVLEALALRLALGPLAVFSRCAGRWCVIVMRDLSYGSGLTVTAMHRERGRALLEAIGYAVEARPMAHRTKAIGQQLARAITGALHVTPTTARCPKCKARKVVRLAFGSIVLGHSCRACKWERAKA